MTRTSPRLESLPVTRTQAVTDVTVIGAAMAGAPNAATTVAPATVAPMNMREPLIEPLHLPQDENRWTVVRMRDASQRVSRVFPLQIRPLPRALYSLGEATAQREGSERLVV